jgi:hypothetical protein
MFHYDIAQIRANYTSLYFHVKIRIRTLVLPWGFPFKIITYEQFLMRFYNNTIKNVNRTMECLDFKSTEKNVYISFNAALNLHLKFIIYARCTYYLNASGIILYNIASLCTFVTRATTPKVDWLC